MRPGATLVEHGQRVDPADVRLADRVPCRAIPFCSGMAGCRAWDAEVSSRVKRRAACVFQDRQGRYFSVEAGSHRAPVLVIPSRYAVQSIDSRVLKSAADK